jgi:methyl-accepting chemotaxis protein
LNPAIVTATTKLDEVKELSQEQAEAKVADARSTAQRARVVLGLALLIGVVLAGGFALFIASVFNRRVRALSEVLTAIADGDLTEREPDSANNEVGQMSRSAHQAATRMRAAVRTLARTSAGLSERSVQLQEASRNLAEGTDQTSARVEGIGNAAEQVSAGVQAVAGGAREMGAAIREISVSANEAAMVADNAVEAANQAEHLMRTLDSSSAEIDNVVKTITAIAEQTNLLALNATIEAARAGETGKGFAVVAGEVKDLAQATAKATVEISRRIEAIQSDTRSAVESITGISQVVTKINDYQSTIASAVEQQSATTDGMTNDLGSAAGGASQISDQLAQVGQVTATTRGSAQATQAAADELTRISDELNTTVAAFRY